MNERASERVSERRRENVFESFQFAVVAWRERGVRGRDWSAVAERGAELYYGNYMINTTRPWALSSPSRSSFQSRSSARSSLPSVAGISLLSRLRPRLSTRGIVALLIPPFLSPAPPPPPRHSFDPVAVSTSEHWRFALKYASSRLRGMQLILFPFDLASSRHPSQRDE